MRKSRNSPRKVPAKFSAQRLTYYLFWSLLLFNFLIFFPVFKDQISQIICCHFRLKNFGENSTISFIYVLYSLFNLFTLMGETFARKTNFEQNKTQKIFHFSHSRKQIPSKFLSLIFEKNCNDLSFQCIPYPVMILIKRYPYFMCQFSSRTDLAFFNLRITLILSLPGSFKWIAICFTL